jgi:hypothetical protein
MQTPFKELKHAEVEALRWRRSGKIPPAIAARLRKLVTTCRKDPEASAAICYHGSLALLYELDEDWLRASKHRRTEISFIEKLYRSLAKDPSSVRRWATQSYRAADLNERRRILKYLEKQSDAESASRNRRPAPSRRVRATVKGGGP